MRVGYVYPKFIDIYRHRPYLGKFSIYYSGKMHTRIMYNAFWLLHPYIFLKFSIILQHRLLVTRSKVFQMKPFWKRCTHLRWRNADNVLSLELITMYTTFLDVRCIHRSFCKGYTFVPMYIAISHCKQRMAVYSHFVDLHSSRWDPTCWLDANIL